MEEKKGIVIDESEIEIRQIERDFRNIMGEVTDIANIREFKEVYKQLHSLLLETHAKNKKLTFVVQSLNHQIISNATKVSSLLKMSDDDHKFIEQYKEEYNKVMRIVNATQEKERKASDLVANLQNEVERLGYLIHKQGDEENDIISLKSDIINLKDDSQQRIGEIRVLELELQKVKSLLIGSKDSLNEITQEIEASEAAIDQESKILISTKASKNKLEQSIEKMQNEISGNELQLNENKSLITNRKKRNNELQSDLETQRMVIDEEKRDLLKSNQKLRDAQYKFDRNVLSLSKSQDHNNSIETQYRKASESQILLMKQKELIEESAIVLSNNEIEIKKESQILKADLGQMISKRNVVMDQYIRAKRQNMVDHTIVNSSKREADSQAKQVKIIGEKVLTERKETLKAESMSQFAEDSISYDKNEIEKLHMLSHEILLESENFQDETINYSIQKARIDDQNHLLRIENNENEKILQNINTQCKEHERIVNSIREERDKISNKISGIIKDNEEMFKQIESVREQLYKMKKIAQKTTQDCIEVHFESRTRSKEISSLEEMVEMSKRLNSEAQATLVGYKGEQTKLLLIFNEATKDVSHTRTRLRHMKDSLVYLKNSQFSKVADIKREKDQIAQLENRLNQYATKYDNICSEIDELREVVTREVFIFNRLKNVQRSVHGYKMEKITLETQLLKQSGIRNAMEYELDVPRNFHRWLLVKEMNPELYQRMQMISYLKNKLELAGMEVKKLLSTREDYRFKLNKIIKHIKNIPSYENDNAIIAYRSKLEKSDIELIDIENSVIFTKKESEKYIEQIKDLRKKLNRSKTSSTSIKKHVAEAKRPDIPPIPISEIDNEPIRLGGGFNLTTGRPNTARPTYKVNQIEFEIESSPLPSSRSINSSSSQRSARSVNKNREDTCNTNRVVSSILYQQTSRNPHELTESIPELCITSSRSKTSMKKVELTNGISEQSQKRRKMKSSSHNKDPTTPREEEPLNSARRK